MKGSRKSGHTKRSGNTTRTEQMVDSKNVAERLEDEVTHEETRGSFHSVQCIQSSFSVPTIFDKFCCFHSLSCVLSFFWRSNFSMNFVGVPTLFFAVSLSFV